MASVGYDDVNGTLEVEFNNGRVYEYFRVPRAVFDGLMMASSKGRYFADRIQHTFRYSRLT